MSNSKATECITILFEGHGLSVVTSDDWVIPNSTLPALRALWYPTDSGGELQVQLLVREQLVIEECFAGFGDGDEALRDAIVSFTLNSFHVLLAAFWGKTDPDQVNIEEWLVGGKRFVAYFGNFGLRNTTDVNVNIPDKLFDSIQEAIQRESLLEELHWFRFFCGVVVNDLNFEALKNNEPWQPGVRCLEAADWERSSGYYSVRLFMVLVPCDA